MSYENKPFSWRWHHAGDPARLEEHVMAQSGQGQQQPGQQPGQQGQHVEQILQQLKQQSGGSSDPTQTFEQALTMIAQRLQAAATDQNQVRQLAQELQQRAREIAEACCE